MASTQDIASTHDAVPVKQPTASWRRIVGLVVGDACMFLLFATLGWASHGQKDALWWVVGTSGATLALSWFAIAPFFGVYRQSVTAKTGTMLLRTALAWVCAWPIGFLLRWLLTHTTQPLTIGQQVSFAITTLLFTMIFLEAWRGIFGLLTNRRR
jgi:hypothetical protein